MGKHTPGPWIHGRDVSGSLTLKASPADPLWYAGPSLILSGDGDQEKALANARLIAAAPALAEALAGLLAMADDRRFDAVPSEWSVDARLYRLNTLTAARKAMAKAGLL